MSYPVLPALPLSLARGLKKSPNFGTVIQATAAGASSAIAVKPYPTWDFEFGLDYVQGNEGAALTSVSEFLGAFMQCAGRGQLFLFTDPQDNAVTAMPFGTGDGATTAFQLSRLINSVGVDVIQNVNGTPNIYVAGTLTVPASISATGVVTFSAAPANGAALTWSGSFYFLCRFHQDTLSATRVFTRNSGSDLWVFDGVKFSSEFVAASTYGKIQ